MEHDGTIIYIYILYIYIVYFLLVQTIGSQNLLERTQNYS